VTSTGEHAERFTHLRPLLFTIVYEILGSATESDDVLQDSYLRWAEVDLATVRDTKSYLAQLVTSQALNALRARARRREEYIGPWLPEPLLLDEGDASSDVVLAEEVFGFDYDEIAGAVGKSAATVRQMAHRAREHVHARRNRFGPVDAERTEQITNQFLTGGEYGRHGWTAVAAGARCHLDGRPRRQGKRVATATRRREEGGWGDDRARSADRDLHHNGRRAVTLRMCAVSRGQTDSTKSR
jgi:DNA-directed RNA polymerase specialized sigma24 family protein